MTVQFWQFVDPATSAPLPGIFPGARLVQQLGSALSADSFHVQFDGTEIAAHSTKTNDPRALVFYTVRRDELPAILRTNLTVEELILTANEGVVEATHAVLFERNVLGILYNHFGPRPRRFSAYLRSRFNLDVELVPVLRPDVMPLINRMDQITRIDFALPVATPLASQGTRYGQALRGLQDASSSKVIHVAETIRGSKTPNAVERFRNWITRDVLERNQLDKFDSFKIRGKGPDLEIQTVDLLGQILAVTREVDTAAGTRNVSSAAARDAIETAWSESRQEIQRSVATLSPNEPLTFNDLEADTGPVG